MKVTLLGTNGWYDTPAGSTPCVLVQTDDYDIFFDAGMGFSKADALISGEKPAFLFLSHFHYDHLFGLHTLAKFRFDRGLRILGLPGIHSVLTGFFDPKLTIPLDRLHFQLTFEEFTAQASGRLPFAISSLPLIHSGPCQGYRLEIDGRVVTYCTDTGYCDNAISLARGADLFLCECALPPGTSTNPHWPHLNPNQAAQIAREASCQQLVLIHFDPAGPQDVRAQAQAEASRVFPRTVSGSDGMSFTF